MLEDCIKISVSMGCEKYPNTLEKHLEYGTAGFRDKATVLAHVMFRMGQLATLRSKTQNGAIIGVMITASHNPQEDNGVKLCDPSGQLLNAEWEVLATELANAKDDELEHYLKKIITNYDIKWNVPANVFVGRDTRLSSPGLAAAVCDGVKSLGGALTDFGLLTTPQLHYVVCCQNTNGDYGIPTTAGYCKKLSSAFLKLSDGSNCNYKPQVFVDAANGIGAHALKELLPHLDGRLELCIFNDGKGELNHKCGADHVKVQQTVPSGLEVIACNRYASLDGDADRLIYFYIDADKKFHMLDGDKIAALVVKHLKELTKSCGLNLQMCVVQTAYANGSSTQYIEKVLGVPVVCVPTGVKYLHHEAMKHEIGVYFEANGHGTIVFQEHVKSNLKKMAVDTNVTENQRKMCQKLLSTIDLINETVGDAISDLLLVEAILHQLGWSIQEWDDIYVDLPNRQLKVQVPDKSMIATTDAGRRCVKPEGLQNSIDTLVAKYKNARAFVRPSGTEDIVRVYTEADTQKNADSLAEEIVEKIKLLS